MQDIFFTSCLCNAVIDEIRIYLVHVPLDHSLIREGRKGTTVNTVWITKLHPSAIEESDDGEHQQHLHKSRNHRQTTVSIAVPEITPSSPFRDTSRASVHEDTFFQ
jgi:hypothetical protein